MDLGNKIKLLRLKKGLTQEELADRCELTKGFISQLENNLTSPSIVTLEDIVTALGSTLKDLFAEDDNDPVVFGKEDYFQKVFDGYAVTWLVTNSQKNEMEPILAELEEGGTTGDDLPHEGEEFGFVLEGKICLTLGKQTYLCKKGDTFYYTADKVHSIKNAGKSKAKFLWVSSPPNF